jgi:hypothetical protein
MQRRATRESRLLDFAITGGGIISARLGTPDYFTTRLARRWLFHLLRRGGAHARLYLDPNEVQASEPRLPGLERLRFDPLRVVQLGRQKPVGRRPK